MRKLSVLMSALVMALAFVACESDKKEPTPKLSFKVGTEEVKDAVKVELGKTAEVTVSGGTADYKAESSDVKVATVEVKDNVITVTSVVEVEKTGGEEAKPATATITVTDKNGVKGEFKVTITEKATLTFDEKEVTIVVGETADVKVSGGVAPYEVKSTDEETATVAEVTEENVITITAVAEGETTIEVKDSKGVEGVITVKVAKAAE